MKLLVPIFLNCVFVTVFYLLEKKTDFKKLNYVLKQILIGVVFGGLSAFASSYGVELLGTVANVRDAAPLCAGFIFGGPAGVVSGIIGGLYRFFSVYWGGGVYTRIACTLSTMLAGFIAAILRRFMFDNKKPTWSYGVFITVVCEVLHMLMIFFTNNKERVPFTQEKVSLKDAVKVVFTHKNLLMVSLTKLCGFGRGVYGTVSLYIAVFLLGSKDLKLALLLPMGIGTAVGTLLVNFVLKKFNTKQTYILFCLYGASSMAILFLVSRGIGFNDGLIIPFLILNFFCGLQHGNTNVTPNIMIADCVDEIEYKTGKRQEGLAYAGYGLFSKIASAFTKALGPWLLYTWSGYLASTNANVAYATQSDATLNKILMIYTIIPAIFVVLQAVPIFFYDMVGDKKEHITKELIKRREENASADSSVAEN